MQDAAAQKTYQTLVADLLNLLSFTDLSSPVAANNRLVQRLQSSCCSYCVHAAARREVQFAIRRGVRLVGHVFANTAPSPLGIVTPPNTQFLESNSFFLSSLLGDVAICAEASSGPNAQPHIP